MQEKRYKSINNKSNELLTKMTFKIANIYIYTVDNQKTRKLYTRNL